MILFYHKYNSCYNCYDFYKKNNWVDHIFPFAMLTNFISVKFIDAIPRSPRRSRVILLIKHNDDPIVLQDNSYVHLSLQCRNIHTNCLLSSFSNFLLKHSNPNNQSSSFAAVFVASSIACNTICGSCE